MKGMKNRMTKINFFNHKITRMIIGDNPINGHSYIEDIITGKEMKDYHTPEKIAELFLKCEEIGFNTILPLATPVNISILKKYRAQGGKLHIIFQPYVLTPLAQNVVEMMEVSPIATYYNGYDLLIETGEIETLQNNMEILKKTGLPIGIASHVPEHIELAENNNYGADFYMTCLYNTRRERKGELSGFLSKKSKIDIKFYPEDRFKMFKVIKKVQKPCIAYKVLAGGNIFRDTPRAMYEETVEKYINEVYQNIKPGDAACLGVFQRDFDQLSMNARIFNKIL